MDTAIRSRALPTSLGVRPRSGSLLFGLNVVGLVAGLVILFNLQPNNTTMRTGEVAGDTVVAQRSAAYVDHVATTARKQQAMAGAGTVYKVAVAAAEQRKQDAAAFLSRAAPIIRSAQPATQRSASLRKLLPPSINSATLDSLSSLPTVDFKSVETYSVALLGQAAGWRFDSNQMASTENGLLSALPPKVNLTQRTAIGDILAGFLTPTLVTDLGATTAKQRNAAAQVPNVLSTIRQGEVVVRRGDLITPSIMEKLSALGLQNRHTGWRDVLASLVFATVIIVMMFWYLHAFHPGIVTNRRILLLIDLSILSTVVGARLISSGHVLLPFFLPVAAAPTFAAVLIAPEACVAIALVMSIAAGWVVANSFELTLYYFLSSAAGVLAVRNIRQLKQLIFAGPYIAIYALATALSFGLIDRTFDYTALPQYVAAAAFNGFVSAALALGGFAIASDFFGVTTLLRMLELGQPNQPLLRRLSVKAPGTYNHSVIVASMVERAAEEINANSLIARLAALYHDVGKTTNPHCFVENQMGAGNIHDELRPAESARIIRGHVPQGLRLGRQNKLPRVILDAIAEHHGTMSISYFLHKSQQEDSFVDDSLYMYPGPKPQSKETALLMLADGCESAVRAAPDHSPEKIQAVVAHIFDDRIKQGQFDESPLTLGDLERARHAFEAILNGLYHPRIVYPEPGDLQPATHEPLLSAVQEVREGQ